MPPLVKLPVWKGSKELTEIAGSPDWTIDATGTRILRRFEGPYDKIVAEEQSGRLALGKTMPNLGTGFEKYPIKNYRFVATGEGDVGLLTITLDNYGGGASFVGTGAEGPPKYEEEWNELEKHISTHPYFTEALTDEAISTIVSAAENNEELPAITGGSETETTSLYNRIKSGQDAYTVYVPVIRATTPYSALPPKGGAGQLESPPSGAKAPEGWAWRKTAHRRVEPGQDSRYDLVEEWTGAEEWDPVLYGPNSGLPGTA